jgi:hypothetical protein
MKLINLIKEMIEKKEQLTPQIFIRISKSEETMRMIDTLKGEGYDYAWHELFNLAMPDIVDDVFSLIMGRIKKIDDLANFYYCFHQRHADAAIKKGLAMAKSFNDFRRIAENRNCCCNPETREKALQGMLETAQSSRECSTIIGGLIKRYPDDPDGPGDPEIFLEKSIEKGVSLAKNMHCDIRELRCNARQSGRPTHEEKFQRDMLLAKCLLKSRLVFEHRRQLKSQFDLCEKRRYEAATALEALLTSIIMFDEYKHRCAMVPKGQKKLN